MYTGYRYDPDTGLYQVRNRYLHPKLGRWLSRDPIDYEDGVNLYAYVSNKSIGNADSFGLAGKTLEELLNEFFNSLPQDVRDAFGSTGVLAAVEACCKMQKAKKNGQTVAQTECELCKTWTCLKQRPKSAAAYQNCLKAEYAKCL